MTQPLNPAQKYRSARGNLLAMAVLTAVNLVLILTESGISFSFSAFIPTFAAAFGMQIALADYTAVSLLIAVGCTALYFICWALCRKQPAWMAAALVLFVLDTIAMLAVVTEVGFEMSYVLDVLFHIWVLYYLVTGVHAMVQLRALGVRDAASFAEMTAAKPGTSGFPLFCSGQPVPPVQETVKQYTDAADSGAVYTMTADEQPETAPLRISELDGRVLASAGLGTTSVEVRRTDEMVELVINGWVYAERHVSLREEATLTARVNGACIQASTGRGLIPHWTIRSDGRVLAHENARI